MFTSPSLKCSVCYEDYSLNSRLPRFIPKCGHTFCSECLQKMLNFPEPFRCPNDNRRFEDLKALQDFPENYSLKTLIEESNGLETCPEHSRAMEYACMVHKTKICDRCAIFGGHSHQSENGVKLLSDLIFEVKDKITGLEKIISDAGVLRDNNVKELEKRRFGVLKVIEAKFDEMIFILRAKERQLTLEVNTLFQYEVSNLNTISENELQIGKEIEAKISNYKNIAKAADPFSLIDDNIMNLCTKMENALQGIKLPEVLEDIQGHLDSILQVQINSISKIELAEKKRVILKSEVPMPGYKIWPEKCQRSPHKMLNSPFSAEFSPQYGLILRYDSTKLQDFGIDLDRWHSTQALHFKIESNLELNLEDIKTLCFIRNRLNKVNSIEICAEGEKSLPSDLMINLLEILFYNFRT